MGTASSKKGGEAGEAADHSEQPVVATGNTAWHGMRMSRPQGMDTSGAEAAGPPARKKPKKDTRDGALRVVLKNVQGLTSGGPGSETAEDSGNKWHSFLGHSRASQYDVIMLVEHKIPSSEAEKYSDSALLFGFESVISGDPGESKKGGAAILIRRSACTAPQAGGRAIRGGGGLAGRLAWADARIRRETYRFRAVYAPAESSQKTKRTFFTALMGVEGERSPWVIGQGWGEPHRSKVVTGDCIVGGDWNCVAHPSKDERRTRNGRHVPGPAGNTNKAAAQLEWGMGKRYLFDPLAEAKGKLRGFTWERCTAGLTLERRLDRWYMGATRGQCEKAWVDHAFWAGPEQDHQAIALSLTPVAMPGDGKPAAEYTRIDPGVITSPKVYADLVEELQAAGLEPGPETEEDATPWPLQSEAGSADRWCATGRTGQNSTGQNVEFGAERMASNLNRGS